MLDTHRYETFMSTNLFKEWVSEINQSPLGNKLGRNASLALLGILAAHSSASAAAGRSAGGRRVGAASHRASAGRAGISTAATADGTATAGLGVLLLTNPLRVGSEVVIAVEVGFGNLDVIVETLVGKSAGWRQSAGLGERDGGVRRSTVFIPATSADVLSASRSRVLLALMEETAWSTVKGVKRGLATEEARSSRRRLAAREVVALPLLL
jgi:hypothetical protein